MEQQLKIIYRNALYKGTVVNKIDAENMMLGKVPLRLLLDTEGYPRVAINLPLPFHRIGTIDLHLLSGSYLTDGVFIFDKYPDVTNRIHQHVFTN